MEEHRCFGILFIIKAKNILGSGVHVVMVTSAQQGESAWIACTEKNIPITRLFVTLKNSSRLHYGSINYCCQIQVASLLLRTGIWFFVPFLLYSHSHHFDCSETTAKGMKSELGPTGRREKECLERDYSS